MECIELNGPISLCGILVEPVGFNGCRDDSGVCVVPYEYAEIVLKEAQNIANAEEKKWENWLLIRLQFLS